MAIVHTLPVPLEPAPEATTALQAPTMGSVSSLISGRPCPGGPAPPRHHGPPGPTFFRQQDGLLRGGYETQEPLCPAVPPRKTVPGTSFTYVNEDFRTETPPSPSSDIEDTRDQRARSAHLRGPPPKLIPVSGKLEKVRTSLSEGAWVESKPPSPGEAGIWKPFYRVECELKIQPALVSNPSCHILAV